MGAGKNEKPKEEIRIIKAVVFTSPLEEVESRLLDFVKGNIDKRLHAKQTAVLPSGPLLTITEDEMASQLSTHKKLKLN